MHQHEHSLTLTITPMDFLPYFNPPSCLQPAGGDLQPPEPRHRDLSADLRRGSAAAAWLGRTKAWKGGFISFNDTWMFN